MAFVSDSLKLPVDGRQSQTALAIARGTARLLHAHGRCVVSELPLPSGRRADLVALDPGGEFWIVEIKSSIADFRADQKWQDYRAHCDRLFFATTIDVPCEIFPPDTGLIVADAFGARIQMRGARAQVAGGDTQVDDVAVRQGGCDAFAIACRSDRALLGRGVSRLPRRALGQNPLQGAAVHVEPARGFGNVAAAEFVDALDVLPPHAVGRHRIFRRLGLDVASNASSAATTSSASTGLAR